MSVEKEKIKKILVAKLRHHGDVLLITPTLKALKKAFPNAKVHAYIYKECLPMLEGLPYIDGYVLYDKKWKRLTKLKRYLNEIKLLHEIRQNAYDMVINLTEGDRGAIAALLSKAKYRLAEDPKSRGMFAKRRFYTHLSKPYKGMRHTVNMNLDVLEPIGVQSNIEDRYLDFSIPNASCDKVDALLKNENIQQFILIHPVSRWMFKCWPAQKVAEFIDRLAKDHHKVVLSAAPIKEEMLFNQKVRFLCKTKPIDFSGKLSLKDLGALIKRSEAIVSVDSVPMHMAAAIKTPLVAIFGPTSEKRWAPWQHSNAQIVYLDMPCRPCYQAGCNNTYKSACLENLEVDRVFEAFQSLKLCPK